MQKKQVKIPVSEKREKIDRERMVKAVAANEDGEIFELEGYAQVGMAGLKLTPLTEENTIVMPHGSEVMLLPEKDPVYYNIETDQFETVTENPYVPGERIYQIAAFNSPGYVNRYMSAYSDNELSGYLPLFSYGAVGWLGDGFRSAAIQVDWERRQDLRLMPTEKVVEGVAELEKVMRENRLYNHLQNCALNYGCPAAKNFFIGRCEAPLPTSQQCNANCLGCISLQKSENISCCQERISFTPTSEEIAAIALHHINRVEKAVVSFGQGCEGDPLLAAHVIGPAIEMIRSQTGAGTINMNTNGSLPQVAEQLFKTGLDSIRISMNSVRKECYEAYFRPSGYSYEDVVETIRKAKEMGKFVAINYLNCPGVTDTPQECEALEAFVEKEGINLIQWRNLNYDPLRYFIKMCEASPQGKPMGMNRLIENLKKRFPHLKHGYFNPAKENFN